MSLLLISFRLASLLLIAGTTHQTSAQRPIAQVDRLYWDHVEGFCVSTTGKEIYAGSRNRLYFSSDFGKNWVLLGKLPTVKLIRQIIPISRRTIFINASNGGYGECFLSTDSGHTFCESLPSTGAGNCASFIPETGTLYAAAENPFNLMRSDDSGFMWAPEGSQLDSIKPDQVCSLLITSDRSGKEFYVSTSRPPAIYCKTEQEHTWRKCFQRPTKELNREVPLVTKWGNRLVACLANDPHGTRESIYLSEDDGDKWRGIKCPFIIWGIGVNASDPKTIWVGNYGGYTRSKDSSALQFTRNEGLTWQLIPNCEATIFWQLQVLADGTLFAATDFGLLRVKLN